MTTSSEVYGREPGPIPAWAAVLAAAVFLCVEGLFLFAFARYESNPPMLPFQLAFGAFIGSLLALIPLGAGYVNRDARRRGMNAGLWTVLAIFIPNAIGFLLYFVLRKPVRARCGECGALARSGAHYCASCGLALAAVCSRCGGVLTDADAYCPNCGLKRQA
jgi:hypothetical protein